MRHQPSLMTVLLLAACSPGGNDSGTTANDQFGIPGAGVGATCGFDSDCRESVGLWCDPSSGRCAPRPIGAPCDLYKQCQSGFCSVDGVCAPEQGSNCTAMVLCRSGNTVCRPNEVSATFAGDTPPWELPEYCLPPGNVGDRCIVGSDQECVNGLKCLPDSGASPDSKVGFCLAPGT
jgi:hypothetical protein